MKISPETLKHFQFNPEAEANCTVTVAYEDTPARERALRLCHHLVRGFWAEIGFEFSWWRFRYLQDADIAQAAAEAAAEADLLLFAASGHDLVPEELRNWVELWIPRRRPQEGVILMLAADDPPPGASAVHGFLTNVARRAGMDCLPHASEDLSFPAPEGVRRIENRAMQGSRVLDDILRHWGSPPGLPTHWGINE
jgi:hypothetical protein